MVKEYKYYAAFWQVYMSKTYKAYTKKDKT